MVLAILLLVRRSLQTAAANSEPLGTRWLKFWIYWGLPIGALTDFSRASHYDPPWGIVCSLISVAVRVVMIFGLHNRKGWAWKWNWVLIAWVGLILAIPKTPFSADDFWGRYITTIIVFGLVWMWPNYVYWKKRRGLFSGGSHRGKAPLMGKTEVSEMTKEGDGRICWPRREDNHSCRHRYIGQTNLNVEVNLNCCEGGMHEVENHYSVEFARRFVGWRYCRRRM